MINVTCSFGIRLELILSNPVRWNIRPLVVAKKVIIFKAAQKCPGLRADRQTQVEDCEIPFTGAFKIICRERFETVPY